MALDDIKLMMLKKHCEKENIRFEYAERNGLYGPAIIADNDKPDREETIELAKKYGFEVTYESILEDDDRYPLTYYYLKSKSIA